MATRKEKISFAIRRFKGFWDQYKQSKRGLLGITIILFFGVIAIFGPLMTPYDPIRPRMQGYYPGQQPAVAEQLCVPAWYKHIPWLQNVSENLKVVSDHEFTSKEKFEEGWSWESNPSQYNVTVRYSETKGNHDNDGCIEISYMRETEEIAPSRVSVILAKKFEYPYNAPPKSIWMHFSLFMENRTTLPNIPVVINIRLRRGNEVFPVMSWQQITCEMIVLRWKHDKGKTAGPVGDIEEKIFTKAGNYTYEFELTILDEKQEEEKDLTIYLDNVDMILYGNAFGFLGTDNEERTPRDLFTRLIHGTRISFAIGLLTAFFSILIGLVVGLVAGYCGGAVDELLMRFADFMLVLPGLPLLIVLVMVLGASIWNIIAVLIFMGWMSFSRSVRSMVLSLRERPFVEAAKASGGDTAYIIRRHILPNVFALVYVSLATSVPGAILSEASLAWLGLGDINVASWGMILYDFQQTQTALVRGIGEYWFWVLPPGIAIALMAMAFILIGFSLDEILNPKLRQRR